MSSYRQLAETKYKSFDIEEKQAGLIEYLISKDMDIKNLLKNEPTKCFLKTDLDIIFEITFLEKYYSIYAVYKEIMGGCSYSYVPCLYNKKDECVSRVVYYYSEMTLEEHKKVFDNAFNTLLDSAQC